MKYIMKSGKLYLDGAMLIQCKSRRISPWKIICDKEGKELLYTEIYQKNSDVSGISDMQTKESSRAEYGDIVGRRYLLRKMDGSICTSAAPFYAAGERLTENGFPVCRMPRVDHALMDIQGKTCVLIRKKWGEYVLQDEGGKVLMQILYAGALGLQYEIETCSTWKPEMIVGIVQLSRYMERESEFLNV